MVQNITFRQKAIYFLISFLDLTYDNKYIIYSVLIHLDLDKKCIHHWLLFSSVAGGAYFWSFAYDSFVLRIIIGYISSSAEHRPGLPSQQTQPAAREPPPTPSAWAKPKQQQAQPAQEPPPQRRRPADAPPPGFAGVRGLLPSQEVVTPPPGVGIVRGKTPPGAVSTGI
jgi:hypothetical protein